MAGYKGFLRWGEVEADVIVPLENGFSSFNGYVLPSLNNGNNYALSNFEDIIIWFQPDTDTYYLYLTKYSWKLYKDFTTYLQYNAPSATTSSGHRYKYKVGDSSWTFDFTNNGQSTFYYFLNTNEFKYLGYNNGTLIWSLNDINRVIEGTDIITSSIVVENVPIGIDSTFNPDAVYNGWMSRVQAEPWMTYDATSAVFRILPPLKPIRPYP